MVKNNRIYVNLLFLTIVIVSYIGLLFFISNEGLKTQDTLPRHGAIDAEMMKQSIPIEEADLNDIQINKNLIDVK